MNFDQMFKFTKASSNSPPNTGLSDIKIVNEFSPNTECVRYDSRISMESSLCNDIRLWEQICDVDKSIINSVEKGFHDIDDQIQSLAAQFDVCFTLQQKAEERYNQFQRLVRGTTFTKFSRSNCRKTMPRMFYYCSYWDALCWKQTNQRYPKQNQMISVSSILQVHTNVQVYRKIRKSFALPQWADQECFLAIEAKKNCYLELLAPDPQTRNLFVKVIETLVTSNKSVETNFLVTQYGMDVNNVRRMLDTTRQLFAINIERLKNSFIRTTQTMISEERKKVRNVKKKSIFVAEKNKQTVEELLLEKEMLINRIRLLETSAPSARLNHDMVHINSLVQDILANNGDCSIQNESMVVGQRSDPYGECCLGLERLRVHMDTSHNIETQLRQELVELQQSYQNQIVETRQSQHRLQCERDDLLQSNEELALKLDEFQGIIHQKEQQFSSVVKEMREAQVAMQRALRSHSQTDLLQQEVVRSKQIQVRLAEFKTQAQAEDRNTAKILGGLLGLMSYLLVPQDLGLTPDLIVGHLLQSIPFILGEQSDTLDELTGQVEGKIKRLAVDCKDTFLDQIRSVALSLRYMGLKGSRIHQSPTTRPGTQRKGILSGGFSSPAISSNRNQTHF